MKIQKAHSKFVPATYRKNWDPKMVPYELTLQTSAKISLDDVLHSGVGTEAIPRVPIKIEFENFRNHEDLVGM